MLTQEDIDSYTLINDKLRLYDWFISPYYSVLEIKNLKNLASGLTPPNSIQTKENFGQIFSKLLIRGN